MRSGDIFHGVYVGPSATLSVTGEKVSIRNTSGGNGLVVVQAQSVRLSAGTYSGATEHITIYYNCIGAFSVPDRRKIPAAEITMGTRKGVAVSYSPDKTA